MSSCLIVGGGPAGAAAAIRLAQAGLSVTIWEKNAGPVHKVCGDFLSGAAISSLAELGIDLRALGAKQIRAVRLIHGEVVAESSLPFPACSLSRRVLDGALLRRAAESGAFIEWSRPARSFNEVRERLNAGAVFLATGKHELRGAKRAADGGRYVGFKMQFALAPEQRTALEGHVEIVLHRGGYAGLQLVEEDAATLCFLLRRDAVPRAPWPDLIAHLEAGSPHLASRLAGARPLWRRPLTIAGMPYGWVHADAERHHPALFRIGDQAAVVASFTGDGVAIALKSAAFAADALLAGDSAQGCTQRVRRAIEHQVRRSAWLQEAAGLAWAQPWVVKACRWRPELLSALAKSARLPQTSAIEPPQRISRQPAGPQHQA